MQIGIRWGAGNPLHPSVPEALHAAIQGCDTDGHEGAWTLTWLEGRPVCTRDDDVVVTLSASGDLVVRSASGDEYDDDDDWL